MKFYYVIVFCINSFILSSLCIHSASTVSFWAMIASTAVFALFILHFARIVFGMFIGHFDTPSDYMLACVLFFLIGLAVIFHQLPEMSLKQPKMVILLTIFMDIISCFMYHEFHRDVTRKADVKDVL